MTKRPQPLEEPDPLIGKTLDGRFLVQSLIDRGGMGKVYRAVQQPLGRPVALKTLDLLDPRGEFRERFFNEASTCSKLTHPNTVRIFDYGRSEEGVYFLTMELLEGKSLHKVVKSEAPMPPLRVIPIMRQVCGALHEAHEQGIVHRDLKPGNIYLTQHGDDAEFAKVLDFGLVKDLDSDVNLSQTGQALGSPLYMSPEQVEGDPVDRRSDIYALGLVLYVALTGRVPFKKGSVATIMMQQVTGTIPTFDEIAPGHTIPFSLEWVVRRCIEKKPEHRIATTRELSRALKICAAELRGELDEPVEWKLSASGLLDLQPGLSVGREDTNIPLHRPPLANVAVMNDIPSSPTLNRSVTSTVATGAVVAGGGLLVVGGGLVAAAIVVLLVVGFVLYGAPAPEPVPPTDPVPVQPVVPDVAPAVVEVRITSDPDGAEVMRDGALLGSTPLVVKLTDGQVELEVQAEGYETRKILADGTVELLNVPLKRQKLQITPVEPKPAPIRTPTQPAVGPKPSPPPGPKPSTPNMTEIRDPWEDG